MRISALLIGGLYLFRTTLYAHNNIEDKNGESINILGIKWKKTGLEIPITLWIVSNILSTIFSKNPTFSLHGSYDRWEGLFTTFNYILVFIIFTKALFTQKLRIWTLWSTIAAGAISGFYGIMQSLGKDFISWSMDPTKKVFACINNPVHYCAYMGMLIPVCFGLTLYYSSKKSQCSKTTNRYLWIIFIMATMIYYNQFLSYSRATWMGFLGAMTLILILSTTHQKYSTWKKYLKDISLVLMATGTFYLIYIFRLYLLGIKASLILAIILSTIAYLIYKNSHSPQDFIGKILIIFFFANLQFIATSILHLSLQLLTLAGIIILRIKSNTYICKLRKDWIIMYLSLFMAVLLIPPVATLTSKLLGKEGNTLKIITTANGKISSYSSVAIDGTARTSMWKSSLPWIKENPVLGTGLDTIKMIYPVYRRIDYGKLEGGHHFTPDRLHNEYLNTLATKGIFGFIVFYILLIGTGTLIALKAIFNRQEDPTHYLILGCVAGYIVYLGQVMFNFGVVATLFLFYLLFGLSQNLSNQAPEEPKSE